MASKFFEADLDTTIKAIQVMAEIGIAWTNWKASHDYTTMEMQCCSRSTLLFEALNKLEAILREER